MFDFIPNSETFNPRIKKRREYRMGFCRETMPIVAVTWLEQRPPFDF